MAARSRFLWSVPFVGDIGRDEFRRFYRWRHQYNGIVKDESVATDEAGKDYCAKVECCPTIKKIDSVIK